MGLFDWMFGSGDKIDKLSTMTPEQTSFLNSMIQNLSGGGSLGQGNQMSIQNLMEMLNPSEESFNKFADPYKRQFEQETVPMLAERFAGAGGGMGGGMSSSGFGQALSSAGGNLQSQLAQLKAGLSQNAAGMLMGQYGNQSSQALGAQPFAYAHRPGSGGAFQNFINSYAGAGFPGMNFGGGGAGGGMQGGRGPSMGGRR